MLIHITKDGCARTDLTGYVFEDKDLLKIIVKEKDNAGRKEKHNHD